jgi:hypothetical protein
MTRKNPLTTYRRFNFLDNLNREFEGSEENTFANGKEMAEIDDLIRILKPSLA